MKNGKKVIVLNDSMLQHQKPDILLKSGNNVNVCYYLGATKKDIADRFKRFIRKKHEAIIINVDTNNLKIQ